MQSPPFGIPFRGRATGTVLAANVRALLRRRASFMLAARASPRRSLCSPCSPGHAQFAVASGCASSTTGVNWTAAEACLANLTTSQVVTAQYALLANPFAFSSYSLVSGLASSKGG